MLCNMLDFLIKAIGKGRRKRCEEADVVKDLSSINGIYKEKERGNI